MIQLSPYDVGHGLQLVIVMPFLTIGSQGNE
jgi:hypothetical protein